jgi:hypothetical protein
MVRTHHCIGNGLNYNMKNQGSLNMKRLSLPETGSLVPRRHAQIEIFDLE